MKILLVCSKAFYDKLDYFKKELECLGHDVSMPNRYDAPKFNVPKGDTDTFALWKAEKIKHSEEVIKNMDAILVLNYDKNGQKNYIGGAAFLEIYDAFRLGKKIFFINALPDGILKDELIAFKPTIINGDLKLIK